MIDPRHAQHPHPAPSRSSDRDADVVVVGGGHAGIEAALAAARLGAHVVLVSFDLDKVGEMSCNPAIGGLGKGQIVREIDALGGAMAQVADATGIQFRMLNTAKGAAVRAPRCQSDRHRYREEATRQVRDANGVELVEGAAAGLVLVDGPDGRPTAAGIRLEDGRVIRAPATILTTGTFLRAVMHTGESKSTGGRIGERSADGLSGDVATLGLRLGRLKTGTPPRLDAASVDFGAMDEQPGDARPRPFSYATDPARFPELTQVPCHITYTSEETHRIIRDNVHRAPMYSGAIEGVGPRYCPSVEDKIMRFPDRDRHQIFVEPEGLQTDVLYVNGISTSLPADVQEAFVRTVPGLERARFLRHGYAVEYDFVQPSQLSDTLQLQDVAGLFLAGQINGTSGYEEAAGQGLIAGANAALWCRDEAPFVLHRHEAYIGVMVDDLVITNPTEPYRMFSSRAEYRLLLRQDNADRRLVARAAEVGLVPANRARAVVEKEAAIAGAIRRLGTLRASDGKTLLEVLRRPEATFDSTVSLTDDRTLAHLPETVRESVEIDVKYEGYIERQRDDVERLARQESVTIPRELDYETLDGLGNEAREKLSTLRPRTLGAAARIEGVRPPDVALVGVHVARIRAAEKERDR
ncbi:MAG: tRNA uridine-5-carboxymethylaminomethyl(34) synthesis enzyme MnmG [Planctomycetota bacterium]